MIFHQFECCGVNGPNDWSNQNPKFKNGNMRYVPDR